MDYEVPNLTNKIIGIIIAMVVALTVLVPICSELGSESGGGEGRSAPMSFATYTLSYNKAHFMQDNGLDSLSNSVPYVLYAPSMDSFEYQEGELIAFYEGVSIESEYDLCIDIIYTHGKFDIVLTNTNESLGQYEFLYIQSGVYGREDIRLYNSYSDIVNDNTPSISCVADVGLIRVFNMDLAQEWGNEREISVAKSNLLYHTDNSKLSINMDDYLEWADNSADKVSEYLPLPIGALYISTVSVENMLNNTLMFLMPTELFGISDIDGVLPSPGDSTYPNIQSPEVLAEAVRPISIHSWENVDGLFYEDMTLTNKYLFFNKDIPYILEDDSNGGNGTSTANTLVRFVPIFVILGIVGAIATSLFSRKESLIG